MSLRRLLPLLMLLSAAMFAATVSNDWLQDIPAKDRARSNPFDSEHDAALAGGKLYQQHCSSCHGKEGEGVRKKPSINTERVRNASPGELQWLLTNGSMKKGMPSWSRLPEPQRWQIITYLKSPERASQRK